VLLAPNSIRWVAADLALLGEGRVVVPMYARQDPAELVAMMHDCSPSVVVVATEELAEGVRRHWPDAPLLRFDELFAGEAVDDGPHAWSPEDDVTIIYTSGTSGRPKGVVYQVRNVDFMLPVTGSAIGSMMALGGPRDGRDQVFHYLPFCFAGSRIVLWTCLSQGHDLRMSTDLDNLAQEMGTAAPHYFLNVPMLLERIRNGVEKNVREQVLPVQWVYDRAVAAAARQRRGRRDRLALRLADRLIFERVRQRLGPNLRCLICGSAPLSEGTQRWFEMLGIAVYQVYGLTETTAIVTMDRPPVVRPGRVGRVLDGVEVRLGEGDELLVRGPNVFDRYWERPDATETAFVDGWFRTGDQAQIDADGTVRVVGRVKNLVVLSSGHNVPPEPIEGELLRRMEGAEAVVLVGHGRSYLSALVSGEVTQAAAQAAVDALNEELPHYRQVRRVTVVAEPFSIDNGLLTANRKLRRGAIALTHADTIEAMYAR
jgi:long-chain acyl-CoA synthetase